MILVEAMPLDEALAELRAVGAWASVWVHGGLTTIYINGPRREKLAEIWVNSRRLVCEDKVWQAIWKHVTLER